MSLQVRGIILKDCPFCGCRGGDLEGPFPRDLKHTVWLLRCGNPDCGVEMEAAGQDAALTLALRWNQRA